VTLAAYERDEIDTTEAGSRIETSAQRVAAAASATRAEDKLTLETGWERMLDVGSR
jgi:hypothetical protein